MIDQTPLFTLPHHVWLASQFRETLNQIPFATDRMVFKQMILQFAADLMEDNPKFSPTAWLKSIYLTPTPTTGLPGDLEPNDQ